MVKPSKVTKSMATAPEPRTLLPHEIVLSPNIQNAIGVLAWSKFAGEPDLSELVKELRDQVKAVADGNMRPVETMLFGQAMALQTMFTNLARRAATNDTLKQLQINMTLALKCQAQCRATLEALAEIKNPRQVAFVKQANIANQQQVNNGPRAVSEPMRAGAHAHAEENSSVKNELLEASNGQRLDGGAQSAAGRVDQNVEAMAAGQRTAHG